MRLSHRVALAPICVFAFAAGAFAADAPSPKAVQIGIAFDTKVKCNSKDVGMTELGLAYFGTGPKDTSGNRPSLQERVKTVLTACATEIASALNGAAMEPYKIIVFLARPTANAPQTTVAHFIYNETSPLTQGSTALPGIRKVTWIYITADSYDTLVSQIVATPIDNPVLAQLGGLFAAVEKPLEKIVRALDGGHELILRVAPSVDLRFARSSIVETDFISTPKRDDKFDLIDANKKTPTDPKAAEYQQLPGSFTMSNTPKTWLTVNAGAAVLVGPVSGAQKMKVDNKAYASDPLTRGMAMAGVTFHVPYDTSTTKPTWQEVFGLFVGGVVSPSGGVAVALSVGWKGLAITYGRARISVQTAPAGSGAGDAVPSGLNPQLVNGISRTTFIGGSYAFK
jgi:hypothetical protein